VSIRPIITLGDPRLRLPGERIVSFGRELHELLDDMAETMRDAPGVGLAAQQIGLPLQVCVIEVDDQLHELVNPRIVRLAGEQADYEGCLSIPGFVAMRPRAERAVVVAQNRHGRTVRLSGTGLLARAIQHEFDHLQGELYVDRLPPGTEILPASRSREEAEDAAVDGTGSGDAAGGGARESSGSRPRARRPAASPTDEELASAR
jgi:peptide deformylase